MVDVQMMGDEHHSLAHQTLVQDTALWRSLKETKINMLEDLRACGWNI